MINDFLDEVWAFVVYWFFGWGLLITGIVFLIYLILRGLRSTKYSSKVEKGFIIAGLVVYIVLLGFIFKSITHYAIDVDPNRYTEEEKSMQKQLEKIGE